MTMDQIQLFTLFAVIFAFLIWGRVRYDLVAFGGLMGAVIMGLVPAQDAFAGFGHPATLVVALVLVISAGLLRSGAVHMITRILMNTGRTLGYHIALMGIIGGILSAFMNNVAALALLMPVDLQTARKAGRAVRFSLMPLSFATILGGMATLIGTPPNIIIATIREEALGQPFAMFDFAPVGGITAIIGLVFVSILGWRLIPARTNESDKNTTAFDDIGDYIAELTVPENSKIIGHRVHNIYPIAEKNDVAILGIIRAGKRLYGTSESREIMADDILALEGTPDALDEFRTALSLRFADQRREKHLNADSNGLVMLECVVTQESRMNGRTAMDVGMLWRKSTILMGISRQGSRITKQLRKTPLQAGDILLLLTPQDNGADVIEWMGCLPLADRGFQVTADGKKWAAIGIFAAAIVAASLELLDLPIALGIVAISYVAIGLIPPHKLYEQIEWPVIVLLGSMIPLGAALETSGGTQLIAGALVQYTAGFAPWVILTILMVVTMTLSDVLNNTATTIVAAPVALQIAQTLGVNADPFLMAVAISASAAFLTPIGHKNNTLILGPGGYSFGDYWRMGLPLEILVVAVSIPLILIFWPL